MSKASSKQVVRPSYVVVLDNIRSGHNVGAIFRLADAFAIDAIHLCGITPTPPHREIRKTALGAEKNLTWQHHPTVQDALTTLQKKGYRLICIEQTDQALPLDLVGKDYCNSPTALVFGHEVWGVSQEALAIADACLEIPQYGSKKSLNVATCVAIVSWEFTKRRSP